MKRFWGCVIIALAYAIPVVAQQPDSTKTPPGDWFLQDPSDTHLQGISVEKTYADLLQGQPSKTVVVAIIDTGIDIDHEDLSGSIWINQGEIAGNGIDDDHNGYIDDIHGWNFLGSKAGNVEQDTYEFTREYIRLSKKFGNTDEAKVSKKEKPEYDNYKKVKEKFGKLKANNTAQYDLYKKAYDNISACMDTLKMILHTDTITAEKLDQFHPEDPTIIALKDFAVNVFNSIGKEASLADFMHQLKEGVDYYGVIVNYGYNENYDSRKIIGDNYSDVYQKNYGNNDVKGPDPLHGTHVAGIIGANRKNNLGIKGIADNVKIMSIRAVPNGDERDKDVANAILYAVDNGAKIINMSFGKNFSPEKMAVDKAVRHAEAKGVLMIHASGNESADNDTKDHFPTPVFLNGHVAQSWIEVAASGPEENKTFATDFSNYGKKSVDVFAPGVDIYSTTPENAYQNESGTSMASPVVAGVAALLMSYFPDLTAVEIKTILLRSSRKFDSLKVEKPGSKELVEFSSLSVTGGVINAYDAVRMARDFKLRKTTK